MDIFYYLWVGPKQAIEKHRVGPALGISKEITNTYFKRLSLEKPNILGEERIKI